MLRCDASSWPRRLNQSAPRSRPGSEPADTRRASVRAFAVQTPETGGEVPENGGRSGKRGAFRKTGGEFRKTGGEFRKTRCCSQRKPNTVGSYDIRLASPSVGRAQGVGPHFGEADRGDKSVNGQDASGSPRSIPHSSELPAWDGVLISHLCTLHSV